MSEKEPKGPVRVKVRVGEVEFEVECEVEQLRGAVDKVLSVVLERVGSSPSLVEGGVVPRSETCKGVIEGLWEEGWFGVDRVLDEVHSEMARRGFHYDRTAVAHALIDLVKDGILSREGKPRRYRYMQKRPPPSRVTKSTMTIAKPEEQKQ